MTRSDGLCKTRYGAVEEKTRKKWADNITEWAKKSFSTTQALVHNRHKWSQLVQRSLLQHPYDSAGYGTSDAVRVIMHIFYNCNAFIGKWLSLQFVKTLKENDWKCRYNKVFIH